MFDQYVPFQLDQLSPPLRFMFLLLVAWSIAWKLVALWKAARHDQKAWFFALFLVNSVGLLELVYLGFFQKGEKNIVNKLQERNTPKKSNRKK